MLSQLFSEEENKKEKQSSNKKSKTKKNKKNPEVLSIEERKEILSKIAKGEVFELLIFNKQYHIPMKVQVTAQVMERIKAIQVLNEMTNDYSKETLLQPKLPDFFKLFTDKEEETSKKKK